MRSITSAAMLIALLLSSPVALAQKLTFRSSVDGFALTLPTGWLQVPKAAIDQTAREASATVPSARPLLPAYAFQYAHEGKWFTYPYILITVRRVGRPSYSDLQKLGNSSTTQLNAGVRNELDKIMNNIKIGGMVFDDSTKTVWVRVGANVPGHGEISGILVIVPTSYGIIQFQGYAARGEYTNFTDTFIHMIRTLQFDKSSEY